MKFSLSVVLPVFNEEGNIERVVASVVDFLRNDEGFSEFEVIAVDDGSCDNTPAILKKLQDKFSIKIVTHSENLGYNKALISGAAASIHPLILFMDADGQFKIDSLKKALQYIPDYDIIAGWRYKRQDFLYRIILGRAYVFWASFLFGFGLKDINCGFKIFKREALIYNHNFNGGLFYTRALLSAGNKGFRIKQIPVEHFPRLKGRGTGANWRVIFSTIRDTAKLKYLLITHQIE